jgi:hypothetical protein
VAGRIAIYDKEGLGGGDGHDYFAILPPVPQLIDAIKTLDLARAEALRNPNRIEGRVRATAIDYVIKEVGDKVKFAGKQAAVDTAILIRSKVDRTQKRPDGPARQGTRLRNAIVCRSLPTVVPGGGVGVGDIAVLNTVKGADGTPFWFTQEFGSRHLIGHEVYGRFRNPGAAYPNPQEFRVHSIFTPEKSGKRMTIRRPIPERAFLREGAEAGDALRMKLLGDAVVGAIGELRAILDGSSARLAPLRQVVR